MNDRLGRPLGWLRLAVRVATSRLGLLTASMLTALVAATLLITASVLSPAVAEQTFRGTVAADLRSGRSVASVFAESARPTRRAAVQRAGVDIVVLALGLLALQQLHRPVGATPDVVLIVAPAVLVLAGTLIVVRLLPWCSRVAALVAARTRGLPAVLGSFEVARRPLRHVAAVAMLALALAAAVFAATTQATWNSFRDNSIALAEPAGVRVSMVPVLVTDRPVDAAADQLAALPEVEAVMPAHHESARSDTRQIDLIGVDPAMATRCCRALAPEPRLLLADEPTGQLDSETGQQVIALLQRLVHESGSAALVATHDPALVSYADRVLYLRDGRLVDGASARHP